MPEAILVPGRAVNPQLREWMQSQNLNPDLYTLRRKEDMTEEELEELRSGRIRAEIQADPYTKIESAGRGAMQSVGPLAGGLTGAAIGAKGGAALGVKIGMLGGPKGMAIGGAIGGVVGGVGGGITGAIGGNWGQEKIAEAVLDDEGELEYKIKNELAQTTNPKSHLAGALIASLPVFTANSAHLRNLGTGLRNLPRSDVIGRTGTKLSAPQKQAIIQSGLQGSLQTGIYGGMHYAQTGELPSVGELAMMGTFGAATTTPTALSRKIWGFKPGREVFSPAEEAAYQSGVAKKVVAASYKQAIDEFNSGKHQDTPEAFKAFDLMVKEAGGGEQGRNIAAHEWVSRRTKKLFDEGAERADVDANLEPVFEGVHGGVGKASEIPATSVGVTLRGGMETESPVAQAIKNTADESSGGLYTTETMRPIDFGLSEAKAAAASARLALNAAENINSGRKVGVKQQEALQQEFARGVKKKYTKKEIADQKARAEKLEKAVEDFGITYKGGEATWKHGDVEYEIRYTREVPTNLKTTSTAKEFSEVTGLNKRVLLTQAKREVGDYRIRDGVITDRDGNPIVAGSKSEHVPLRDIHKAYTETRGRAVESLYEGKPLSAHDVEFTKIHGVEVKKKDPVGKPVRRVVKDKRGRPKRDKEGRVEWEVVQPTRERKVTELPAAAGWRPEPRGGEVPSKYASEYVVSLKAGDRVSHLVRITDSEGRPSLLDNTHVVTKVDDKGFTVRNIGTRGESKIPWNKLGKDWLTEEGFNRLPEVEQEALYDRVTASRKESETELLEGHAVHQTHQQRDYVSNTLEPLLFSRRLEYRAGETKQVGARLSDAEVEGIYTKIKELWPTLGTGKEAPMPNAVHDFINLYVNHKYVRRFQAEAGGKLKPMDTEVRDYLTHMARIRGYEVEKMLDIIDPSTGGFVRGEMLWDARIVRFDPSRATDDTIAHEFVHGFQLDLAASTSKKDRWLAKRLEEDIGPETGAKREAFVEESGLEFVKRYRDSQDAGKIDRFISYLKDVKSVLNTRFPAGIYGYGKLSSADLRRILTLKADTDAPFLTHKEMLAGVAEKLGVPAEEAAFRIQAGLPIKASDADRRFQADPIDKVIKQVQGQLPLGESTAVANRFRAEVERGGHQVERFPYDKGQKELLYKEEGELTNREIAEAAEPATTAGERARAGLTAAERVAHGDRRQQPELEGILPRDVEEEFTALRTAAEKSEKDAPMKFLIENAEEFYASGKPTDLWIVKHMASTVDKLISKDVIGDFPSRSTKEIGVVARQVQHNRFRDENRIKGEFGESFTQKISKVKLSKEDKSLISEYLYTMRNSHGKKTTLDVDKRLMHKIQSDPRLLQIVNIYREPMIATRVRHAAEGPKIRHADGSWKRPSEKGDPYYWPEMLGSKARQTLVKKPNSKEANNIREEILDHWRRKDPAASEETLVKDFDDYIGIMANRSTGDPASGAKFKALRSSEGRGLPYKHTDKDPTRTVSRYINRFSKDMAFYKNIESDPIARSIFRMDDETGRVKPDSVTEFFGPDAVNPYTTRGGQLTEPAHKVIAALDDAAMGFYSDIQLVASTINRLVVSGWIGGPVAGMRDMVSSVVQAFKFLPPAEAAKLLTSYKKFAEGWIESHNQGVNRNRMSQNMFFDDNMHMVLDGVNALSDGVVKWSGRELFEKTARTMLFNTGKMAVQSMANKAKIKPHEKRMLDEMGRWAGVDWRSQIRDRAGRVDHEALNKMGAAFTELVQGTYDARGVPVGTYKGFAAPFLSLSRWSIERFNRYNTHVIRPIQNHKNYRPLLYTTLGALVGGEVINELAKIINGVETKNPNLYETLDSGSAEDIAYHAMYVANLAGYFGIASHALHQAFMASGPYRHRGQEGIPGIVFPAYEIMWGSDNSVKNELQKLQMADYEDGTELTQAVLYFIGNQIRNWSQASRVFYNQVLADDKQMELRSMKRDFAVFKHLHGYKDSSGGDFNWYENAPRYNLLQSNTQEEIAENVGPAIERAWRNAQRKGWVDKDSFKASLASLYRTQSSQIKPSLRSSEDVPENVEFLDFIGRTQNPEAVKQILLESARQDVLAEMRKEEVKKQAEMFLRNKLAERAAR